VRGTRPAEEDKQSTCEPPRACVSMLAMADAVTKLLIEKASS
jgi:hypothetical protein